MIRRIFRYTALAGAVALLACNDDSLNVVNPNSGDTERVLATPNDAEALIAGYYKRWSSGLYGSISNIEGMADVLGMMNYSSLANNCLNTHAPWSGSTNLNSPGHTCQVEQLRLFSVMGEVERVASNFLHASSDGLTLGTPGRDLRAKAFSEFLRGLSLGYLAMVHDSAAVVTPAMSTEDPGKMVDYKTVAESAYVALDRAITYASDANASGANGFPLPGTWLPSTTTLTSAEFVKLAKSYRARFRANVARTPAERAAVNWDLVISDAAGGLTADHKIITSSTAGPTRNWLAQYEVYGLWHQMPPAIIGMGDVSGSYAAWIATPISSRGSGNNPFFMVTPDLRFPQGNTRAEQIADFQISSCQAAAQTCKRYFVNRNGNDQLAGSGFGWSNYDFVRHHSWRLAGDAGSAQNGAVLQFAKTEVDMLQAEGMYRKGNYAGAAALVNITRVKNGLPAITDFNATSPVPGGASCVPRVPNGSTTACGNLMEAIKWEKRMETAYVAFIPWYLDSRGWGDLAEGTPLFWAVPYQEIQARGGSTSSIYGVGPGAGNAPNSAAAKGTYGW